MIWQRMPSRSDSERRHDLTVNAVMTRQWMPSWSDSECRHDLILNAVMLWQWIPSWSDSECRHDLTVNAVMICQWIPSWSVSEFRHDLTVTAESRCPGGVSRECRSIIALLASPLGKFPENKHPDNRYSRLNGSSESPPAQAVSVLSLRYGKQLFGERLVNNVFGMDSILLNWRGHHVTCTRFWKGTHKHSILMLVVKLFRQYDTLEIKRWFHIPEVKSSSFLGFRVDILELFSHLSSARLNMSIVDVLMLIAQCSSIHRYSTYLLDWMQLYVFLKTPHDAEHLSNFAWTSLKIGSITIAYI